MNTIAVCIFEPYIAMDRGGFVLPDRLGFPAWVYDNYKYPMVVAEDLSCERKAEKKLFPHQEFVRSFLHPNNPYRGLLLYYGLGTGKTCASIGVADLFTQQNPPVSILLPASLANNYKKEVLECAEIGLLERSWSRLEVVSPKAVARALKVPEKWVASAPENTLLWPLSPKHNIFKSLVKDGHIQLQTKQIPKPSVSDPLVQRTIDCILSEHYQFIHYNGLTKKLLSDLEESTAPKNPFHSRLVVIDEAHNFISQVVNGGLLAKKLYRMLMAAEGCKIVCLTGTPLINKPYELTYLINMLRGEIRTFEVPILKGSSDALTQDAVHSVAEKLKLDKFLHDTEVDLTNQRLWFSFVPRGYTRAQDSLGLEANTAAWSESEDAELKMAQKLHARLQREYGVSKQLKTHIDYALPFEQEEFEKLFLDPVNNTVKNPLLFQHRIQGTVAYFKSTGEKLLPSVQSNEIVKCDMSNHQFKIYQTVRDKERKMEKKGKGANTGSKVYRAFSRMICNFAFPENMKRPYPHDLRKEMDLAATEGSDEPPAERAERAVALGLGDAGLKKRQEELLSAVMQKLVQGAQQYLVDDLAVYSPKFAAVCDKLDQSPGTALLYTQFRAMEGIGIFQQILKARGWQAVDVVHTPQGKWRFTEPLEAGKRRFIVFPADRTKANILLDLFNSRWDQVPKELLDQIPASANLRGEFAQLLMITQSGAEGLSLRNVRQVHILEPYWNQIRIDQVIGRAVRTCSHQDLPVSERNLRVFTYIASLTPAQLKDSFTIRRMDQSHTSDEHILLMARVKDQLIQAFLDLLKSSSVDCRIHAAQNIPQAPCFAPPVNALPSDRMYHPQGASKDLLDYVRDRMEKKEQVKGADYKIVTVDGTKYVQELAAPGRLYDYQAFKYARNLVLIKASPSQEGAGWARNQ